MPLRLFTAAIFVIASSGVATAEPSWVPLSIDSSGGIVVPVSINGRGPFLFLLDTGSSHSVVGQSLADHLDLTLVAQTAVLTSAGREMRRVVKVDLTTIGSAQSEGLLASVAPSAQLGAIARGVEGIVGQDFLFAFNYTLDYRKKRLSWTDEEPQASSNRLPLVLQRGRYLVRIAAEGNQPPVLLVPDSGASGFVAFSRGGRTQLQVEAVSDLMAVHSLSGRHDARAMLLRELKLGTVTVRNQPVAVIARDAKDELEGDGLLPLHLFDSVSFNARERHVTIRARR